MFNFLAKMKANQQTESDAVRSRFAALMKRAATVDDLNPSEVESLATLVAGMGIARDELEAIAVDARREAELAPLAAKVDDLTRQREQVGARLAKFDSDTQKLSEDHRKVLDKRADARTAIERTLPGKADWKPATAAASEQSAIQARRWQLYGGTDPAAKIAAAKESSRVRFIARQLEGVARSARTLPFEACLQKPHTVGDLADIELRPLPEQDASDYEMMVEALRRAAAGEHFGYLISRADIQRLPTMEAAGRDIRFLLEDVIDSHISPAGTKRHFIPHPGQSQAELDGLVERWQAADDERRGVETRKRESSLARW